ncbi:MAG: helix-turn-helix domain-containing protein [Phyllobacterium sp.]|uniref:helix-turn-helix domain-containing protein n=1 Tax=Phyllobacterium sp. TaxID=1871046 RepID=UPI0030F115D0
MGYENATNPHALPETASASLIAGLTQSPLVGFCGAPLHTRIPAFEFDTRELPTERQFGAWRRSFSPILDIEAPCNSAQGFKGRQMVFDLGSLVFARIRSEPVRFVSAGDMCQNPIDHWAVTLPLDGGIGTHFVSGGFDSGAGIIQVHALANAFAGQVMAGEILTLFVPRDFCVEVAHALGGAESSAIDTGMGRLLADYFIGLAKRLPLIDAANLPELVAATRAMILACVLPSRDYVQAAQAPMVRVLLERARRIIEARLFDPSFNAEALRRDLAISRTGLYRMFEPFGGVMHYVQHRRLLDAHAALTDPTENRRIIEIAEERCFSDGAEFSRAFKRAFGYTPSEARVRDRGFRAVARHKGTDITLSPPEQRLGLLLRRLHG